MSLADDIRGAISDVRKETLDLHIKVTHRAWIGQTFDGTAQYVSTPFDAIVERKQRLVRTMKGNEEMSSHYIGLLEEIPPTSPLEGFTRDNPVDVDDRFILPDGNDLPVMAVDGFYDGGTGVPFYSQVYLG